MRFRRHLPPLQEWTLPGLDQRGAKRWGLALLGAVLTGYLTAYLVIFPSGVRKIGFVKLRVEVPAPLRAFHRPDYEIVPVDAE